MGGFYPMPSDDTLSPVLAWYYAYERLPRWRRLLLRFPWGHIPRGLHVVDWLEGEQFRRDIQGYQPTIPLTWPLVSAVSTDESETPVADWPNPNDPRL